MAFRSKPHGGEKFYRKPNGFSIAVICLWNHGLEEERAAAEVGRVFHHPDCQSDPAGNLNGMQTKTNEECCITNNEKFDGK